LRELLEEIFLTGVAAHMRMRVKFHKTNGSEIRAKSNTIVHHRDSERNSMSYAALRFFLHEWILNLIPVFFPATRAWMESDAAVQQMNTNLSAAT
jgi:hypothetical protein